VAVHTTLGSCIFDGRVLLKKACQSRSDQAGFIDEGY